MIVNVRHFQSLSSPSLRGRGLKCDDSSVDRTSPVSPSLRGRGLKFTPARRNTPLKIVALFARAWIEICNKGKEENRHRVALFARAWIEIYSCKTEYAFKNVALFARAWIEIIMAEKAEPTQVVALFARAWIEIFRFSLSICLSTSPSLRGRGLKSQVADLFSLCTSSPSLRGRGLKLSAQH